MRTRYFLFSVLFILGSAALSGATVVSFQPTPADLYDLDHYRYYEWGITWAPPSGETIVGASLLFDNIRNWDDNPNDLFVNLLDTSPPGVTVGWDGEAAGDQFAGQGTFLTHYEDLPTYPQDLIHAFDAAQIEALSAYSADGIFGLAFDPDCHFWNDGINLTIETAPDPVPEPGTILLLGAGLLGLFGLRKIKYIKK